MVRELSDELHGRIKKLCASGDSKADNGDYANALVDYVAALELVPEPLEDWEASTWILAAIGDAHFLAGNYSIAKEALAHAMHCPDAIGNPFLHLRLGQSQFELGNLERASDELARALILGDREIFESEDPKYFEYITSILLPPEGQESW